ncbi:MAG: tRNA (adenosine(37)-N6)-threonylcarbamoyltransferase complex dimerization subunit type 1 TsaB [Methyloversatilis sp.]|jgi:tRNA threonylcarbamoyladenosine biosynthesis protein TsaB|nr:tRNA (adenosine(37)-N6)-threonylcarbamoyltransferase complex dimerization subunit type 1 TsaB [Methyloversatilis sp.]
MKLLALETSAETASVALLTGDRLLHREGGTPGTHARFVLGWVEALLEEGGCALAEIDGIAFSAGPGSFTGLRLAVSVAQGLAVAADLPLIAVPTLHALAFGRGDGLHLCCMDARMSEVYSQACEVRGDAVIARSEVRVGAPGDLSPPPGEPAQWQACGSGFALPATQSLHWLPTLAGIDASAAPHARDVARLGARLLDAGQTVDAALAAPLYIRDKVAQTTAERLAAGGRA